MSSTDPNAAYLPDGDDATQSPEPQITPAVDPASETREAVAQRPAPAAQFTPLPTQPAPSFTTSTSTSSGLGVKIVAIAAAIALLFGAVAGGVAGGVAGYAIADRNDNDVVTTVPTGNEGEQISSESTATTESVSDIVAQVNPAVVTIENTLEGQGGLFGQGGVGSGSGYIIDEAGHIVTNNHVVEGAGSLKVIFSDGSEADATLVGADPYQDVAVIKVDVPVPATVDFGDSDALRAGDPVLAIGSALGEFTNSVTNGIVSATDRSLDTGEGYRLDNLIQHNAPISPGNSGGPLVDMNGDVVGMNTAVVRGSASASAEGLGFAVAANTVKEIADSIIADGTAQRPFVGISFTDAQMVDPDATGVIIQEVVDGSPADEAGLEAGDRITAINGVEIDAENPFLNLMFEYKPGDTVEFTVEHEDGQTEAISVTLGTRPAESSS